MSELPTPHPSPLPQGKRDGVTGNFGHWYLVINWYLVFGYWLFYFFVQINLQPIKNQAIFH